MFSPATRESFTGNQLNPSYSNERQTLDLLCRLDNAMENANAVLSGIGSCLKVGGHSIKLCKKVFLE